MVPYPVSQVETGTGLVATLGRQIQAHVRADQFFGSTTIGRIGVENVAGHFARELSDLEFNDTTNGRRRSGQRPEMAPTMTW